MSVGQIISGTLKNLLNRDEELYKTRISICRECKLFKIDKLFGEVCNSEIYLNPKTNEISPIPKTGFAHGCGCVLGSKCRVQEAHCPVGKW